MLLWLHGAGLTTRCVPRAAAEVLPALVYFRPNACARPGSPCAHAASLKRFHQLRKLARTRSLSRCGARTRRSPGCCATAQVPERRPEALFSRGRALHARKRCVRCLRKSWTAPVLLPWRCRAALVRPLHGRCHCAAPEAGAQDVFYWWAARCAFWYIIERSGAAAAALSLPSSSGVGSGGGRCRSSVNKRPEYLHTTTEVRN